VKRPLAWFAGLVGIAALGRWLATRSRRAEGAPEAEKATAGTTAADPAEELRRKLAEAREPPDADPVPEAEETESLEERRARVHATAREAIEAMADDGQAS
jgi:hypothetical protein